MRLPIRLGACACALGLGIAGGASLAERQEGGDTLELVQVVFRHGARTPLGEKYWPDLVQRWDSCGRAYQAAELDVRTEDGQPRPENPDDLKQVQTRFPGNCSKGELTLVGQRQALNFGRWLRHRYVEDLGYLAPERTPDAILARTTNYSRTRATLAGVLTGLFPGDKGPIPAITTPHMDEILYANVHSCLRLKQLVKELHKESKGFLETDPGVQELTQKLIEAMGLPEDHQIGFLSLHDALTSMQAHGKPIPQGIREQPELLLEIDRRAVDAFLHVVAPPAETGHQTTVLRLGLGRLMKMLAERMDEGVSGKAQHKMHLYSGHDSTVMPLLVALGKEVESWPSYMSNLVFENWRTPSGERYIKVLYNGEPLSLDELCGRPNCSWEQFKKAVLVPLQISSSGYAEECVVHPKHTDPAGERVEAIQPPSISVGASMSEDE